MLTSYNLDSLGRIPLAKVKTWSAPQGFGTIKRNLPPARGPMTVAPAALDLSNKLAVVRRLMADQRLDAYLIPTTDEHLNEYPPQVRERRAWASHFTGSAGDLLLGQQQAWLFVDFRYHEQAELEADPAQIQVVKLGLEGHKSLLEQLQALAKPGFRFGFDPFTTTYSQGETWVQKLEPLGVTLVSLETNLVDRAWQELTGKPLDLPQSDLVALPVEVAGVDSATKLAQVREAMVRVGADLLPVTKLDQISWLFNLRGADIPHNPVFLAYGLVTPTLAYLCTDLERLSDPVAATLPAEVQLVPYEAYLGTLKILSANSRVLVDPLQTTLGTVQAIRAGGGGIVEASHPLETLKARKNAVEIAQMAVANRQASRSKVRVWHWLEEHYRRGEPLSETAVAQAVTGFYAEEPGFMGLSFPTIAAVGANSSIVHYSHPHPQTLVTPNQFLLLDSGAQYWGGTTDDTRTLVFGTPDPEQIDRYTDVLRAHINCARQCFPKGTTGIQLDGITRADLWLKHLDYGHGTGHGVGAFLNVHEGPTGISKRAAEPLEPGMITSIEPGFYRAGWGGIRLENLYLVVQVPLPEPTIWYAFEPLTYIPFQAKLVDFCSLESPQRQWLQQYHEQVLGRLVPTLDAPTATWLARVCEPFMGS